jgi:hypothetical protein
VHPILYKFEEIGWLESRFEEIEPARSAHFLLTIAVRLLPPSERARYLEEFHAELLDVYRGRRLWHTLSLLRGTFVLRLRGVLGVRGPRPSPRRGPT